MLWLWWRRRTVDDAIENFILARQADGRAPRTIRDYRRVLEPFAAWCREKRLSVKSLNREHVREYVANLRSRGWAEATVAIHIRNLRAFLRWMHEEGHTNENLAQAVKAPGKVIRAEEPLSPDEVRRLLSACTGDAEAVRDRAILLLFLDTGLRIGEMALLQKAQVHFNGDRAWMQVYSPKSRAYRFVILGEIATSALREYLQSRTDDHPALWIGRRGPLSKRGIYHIVKRRARQAGLENRVHPHIFRKTFATNWLDNGGDPERLRVLAGWSSLEMLKIYAGSSPDKLMEAHRRAGPADKLFAD